MGLPSTGANLSSFNADIFDRDGAYRIKRPKGRSDWLLFLTLEGNGQFYHLDYPLTIGPREAVFVPPGVPHDYGLAPDGSRWRFIWAHFYPRPDWKDLLNYPTELSGIHRIRVADPALLQRIEAALLEMVTAFRDDLYRPREKAMNALERALLLLDSVNPQSPRPRWDRRIERAVHYMINQSARKLSIEEVAHKVGLSASRFSHLFKAQLGQSFGTRLESIRLAEARHLLDLTSLSISEIAHQVGFEDPLYFSRRYKKAYGASPRRHRAELRG